MNPDNNRLREELQFWKTMAERIPDDLSDKSRPRTSWYLQRAERNCRLAVYSSLMSQYQCAIDRFGEMGTAWLDYVSEVAAYPDEIAHGGGHKTRPTHAREGLEAAILADDAELVQRGIDACRDLPESYPDEHEPVELYWRARASAEVVAQSDAVEELLRQYESARYDAADDGWLDVLHGLHESDAERVTAGLQTLIDEWAANTNPDVTDAETLLDVDTAVLYVLARRRGLDVQIDHERFPDQVDELV